MAPGVIFANFFKKHNSKLTQFYLSENFFTRDRKLPLRTLVAHILHMVLSRNQNGYEITSQDHFQNLSHALNQDLLPASRSSLCEARQKLSYKAFEYLFYAARLQRKNTPKSCFWKHRHRVFAVDGSKIQLPHSTEIMEHYPQSKSNSLNGVCHYPAALMTTAINLYTGQPTHFRIQNKHGSEITALHQMLDEFERNDVLLLDRLYSSVSLWRKMDDQGQFFISRLKTNSISKRKPAKYLESFLKSNQSEKIVEATSVVDGKTIKIKIRLIRGRCLKDGSPLILATNLLDKKIYGREACLDLYLKRWRVETLYYRSKVLLKLPSFHSKKLNGVLQEIYSNLLILSLTSLLSLHVVEKYDLDPKKVAPNFKNAIEVMRRNLHYWSAEIKLSRRKRKKIVERMIDEIARCLCKKQPGRSYPRLSLQATNPWAFGKRAKLRDYKLGIKPQSDSRAKRKALQKAGIKMA